MLIISLIIGVTAANIALWIAYKFNSINQKEVIARRIGAACVMGIAITGMHYMAMAAAHFPSESVSGAASDLDSQWLAVTTILSTFAILSVTLILSRFDAREIFLLGSVSQLNRQITHLATFDLLTGLPNRWTLMERIKHTIIISKHHCSMFAIFFMNLDGFKEANDSLGHSVGDEILSTFAKRLLQCVRSGDTVARLGGDEFVVLLDNLPSSEVAAEMAESVLYRMRTDLRINQQLLQVTPSIGISIFPQDGVTAEILLKNANTAMCEAKRNGRNTYRFFEASMNEAAVRTLQIQGILYEAIKNDSFSLCFQPKFHGDTGRLTGAEALLRLHDPNMGSLSPKEFIPIAERSGQIIQIGYWVIHEVCRHIRRWKASGLPLFKVAVNLSPRQLEQPDLVQTILNILQREQVSSMQIMFEITETVAMQDAARTTAMIHEFQQNNFEIAIDDFGTGYSSLAYLQRFRAKQLKIDQFFINGLDEYGREGSAIVSAIIKLAHTLEMEVVAEGVETHSQLAKLRDMGCDEIQGYLLGKPMTAEEFNALCHQQTGQNLTNHAENKNISSAII
ncbi:bifunctional diguanylate cyclase/phosphodiesterase [Nitrosomonas sp. PY1]|nr:bifunctional diguanylate cyclase/phosphodiesterase [Nitrosomonas sp. PY1]